MQAGIDEEEQHDNMDLTEFGRETSLLTLTPVRPLIDTYMDGNLQIEVPTDNAIIEFVWNRCPDQSERLRDIQVSHLPVLGWILGVRLALPMLDLGEKHAFFCVFV